MEATAMRQSKSAPDRNHIAVDRPEELKYWCKHLEVTPEELLRLLEKVGNSASAVRKELEMERQTRA
jgi:hypothetical protein